MTPYQITEARALVERLDGYTPGPWVRDCWDILGEGPGTGNVCEVSIPNGVDDKYWKPGEPDNNAALIAAAPDLHAHLTAALDEIERLRMERDYAIERLISRDWPPKIAMRKEVKQMIARAALKGSDQ